MYRWKAYNYMDIKFSFEKLGYEVEEVYQDLLNYDVDEEFAEKLRGIIKGDSFEFVFNVNYFPLISNVCQECGILYVCWSCDNPLISMYHKSVFNDVNRIFLFDLTNVEEFKGMGVEHVYHLPLAVNCERLDYLFANSKDEDIYRNDISFVGSLYEKNSYDKMEYTLPDYLRGYFEALMEAQRDLQGVNIVDRMLTPDILMELENYFKLDKSEDSLSDLNLIFSVTTLGFKIAEKQRRRILIDLSKNHDVSVYTNSKTDDLLRVKNRGSIDYWREMPQVFKNSKINLNITIPNIKSGVPLRVYDILGAGGFCLTNFQAELPMQFENANHLVWYYSNQDLYEKTTYYLTHDTERNEIATNGRIYVENYCTYEKRLKELLKAIK
ncbi:spore maturation protein CgeB [Pseudobutyrivibrio sp. OR37]|nr:spore maturation protein CgeB [Pseudobutyrivibrio sp. OR37]